MTQPEAEGVCHGNGAELASILDSEERDFVDSITYIVNTQQTQNICIQFIQSWTNVKDVGPGLYKCCTHFLCLLGY